MKIKLKREDYRLELNQYLRVVVNDKVRHLFIKDSCEVCNSTNNLHLHHIKLFSKIVEESLVRLNLSRMDTGEYAENELESIVDIVLGKHVRIEYLTLCDVCHKDAHEDNWQTITVNDKHKEHYEAYRKKKEMQRDYYDKNVLIPYLDSIKDKRLPKDDKYRLIDKFTLDDGRGRKVKGISKLNKYLDEINSGYAIISGKSTYRDGDKHIGYRYWIVEESR